MRNGRRIPESRLQGEGRKGVGQLDNTALIRNICRFLDREGKTASGGREITASCFI